MKHFYTSFLIVLALLLSRISLAATPTLADADKLFDFVESAEPTQFFPAAETQQVTGADTNWFYRYFSGTDSHVAINIDGVGPYFGGDVYVLGGQFGDAPLYVDTLETLLATIDSITPAPEEIKNAITNQGNGKCVPRKFALKNDTAYFRTTTFSGDTTKITDRTEFYEEVTNTKTVTVIEQTVIDGGVQVVTSNRYTSYFESLSGLFFNSANDSEIRTSVANLPPSQQISNTTYAPSLFIGPSDLLCEGQQWLVAPVTQTTILNPDLTANGPIISQTRPTSATVDAVDELVSLRGVTYSTIRMTMSYPQGKTITWTDAELGIRVMSETYQGDSENPSSMEVLTQIDLPF